MHVDLTQLSAVVCVLCFCVRVWKNLCFHIKISVKKQNVIKNEENILL